MEESSPTNDPHRCQVINLSRYVDIPTEESYM